MGTQAGHGSGSTTRHAHDSVVDGREGTAMRRGHDRSQDAHAERRVTAPLAGSLVPPRAGSSAGLTVAI